MTTISIVTNYATYTYQHTVVALVVARGHSPANGYSSNIDQRTNPTKLPVFLPTLPQVFFLEVAALSGLKLHPWHSPLR